GTTGSAGNGPARAFSLASARRAGLGFRDGRGATAAWSGPEPVRTPARHARDGGCHAAQAMLRSSGIVAVGRHTSKRSPRLSGHENTMIVRARTKKGANGALIAPGSGETRAAWMCWCPRGDSNPYDSRRYHLKVVRLPIPPPGQVWTAPACAAAAHCTAYCAGGAASAGDGTAAGTSGAAGGGAGISPGAGTGEVADGAGASACDITPRSCWTSGWELRMACQAMNRLMPKKATASHLVVLVMKLDAPRAPNTVPEAPAPKPEPAAAPALRWSRTSTIMAIDTSRYNTLRINISIVLDLDYRGGATARTMARKSAATSEAPPISPPSTSGCAHSGPALSGFTLPPCRIGRESAILASSLAIWRRIKACAAWACSGLAVRPVPMAHTGS